MATKYYDNFIKQPMDKMSQTISDMTYNYKATVVPKSHYKKQLDELVELHMEQAVTSAVLDVYVKTLKHMIEESPVLFVQTLLCIAMKINPTNMRPNEYQALEVIASQLKDSKLKELLSEDVIEQMEDLMSTPLTREISVTILA